ncbi:rCG59235 [Rattus norvegicus]|uniref:RCG59235 n=1 Tax=Rattus norvegicus TaxID=10116 RepID=A6K7G6_RAT|nr:rCG59235 [Rattus norvegicus]
MVIRFPRGAALGLHPVCFKVYFASSVMSSHHSVIQDRTSLINDPGIIEEVESVQDHNYKETVLQIHKQQMSSK